MAKDGKNHIPCRQQDISLGEAMETDTSVQLLTLKHGQCQHADGGCFRRVDRRQNRAKHTSWQKGCHLFYQLV